MFYRLARTKQNHENIQFIIAISGNASHGKGQRVQVRRQEWVQSRWTQSGPQLCYKIWDLTVNLAQQYSMLWFMNRTIIDTITSYVLFIIVLELKQRVYRIFY